MSFECFDDRPYFTSRDGADALRLIAHNWHKPRLFLASIFLVVVGTALALVIYLIYWLTLPFAMLNEICRK